MKLSTAVVAMFLVLCVTQAIASVIPNGKTMDERILAKEYNPYPMESETKESETDEGRDLEYFHVPANNQDNRTAAADYLVDFKTNEFLRRVDSDGVCYLGTLPDKLPKRSNLQTALREVFDTPPYPQNHNIVGEYWVVTEKVDEPLREEIQKFCDPGFPIYRVKKVALVTADEGDGDDRGTRRARGAPPSIASFPRFCPAPIPRNCNLSEWLLYYKIRGRHCTWWLRCSSKSHGTLDCGDTKWDHRYDSIICYEFRCP
nr:uncharacterized protein LOC131800220 [Pocillopora verrucosa]